LHRSLEELRTKKFASKGMWIKKIIVKL
jgi:hypothetical protein